MKFKLNQIQKDILKKFIYNPKLKYNEIWSKKLCSSSNFDYHLKSLIKEGILEKEENTEFYVLTNEGTAHITSIDGESIQFKSRPVVCSFVLAKNKEGRILLSIRKKQPFYDHINIPGGKEELGEFSDETAKREFKEETGLDCDLKLMMISEKVTINLNNSGIEHHIIGYFYLGTNIKGKLIEKTREGINLWLEKNEFKNYKRFIDLDYIIPYLLNEENLNNIKIVQIKRFRKDDEFVNIEIKELN